MTHICVRRLTITGSDNDLSPGRRQAIIWTNAGILLIRTLGTKFSEILGEIHSFSFPKMHLKISSATWRLFALGLNELTHWGLVTYLYILELDHYWFSHYLAACSAPSHFWTNIDFIFNWKKLLKFESEYHFDFFFKKMSIKSRPFDSVLTYPVLARRRTLVQSCAWT